jgi:excisionase family DNA binding protein
VNSSDKLKGQGPGLSGGRMSAGNAAPRTPRFFTVDHVAEFLNLWSRSVRRLIAEHQLPVHRFGHAVRIAEADLRTFIATHRAG